MFITLHYCNKSERATTFDRGAMIRY